MHLQKKHIERESEMTNLEQVRNFIIHAHNTPFTVNQIVAGTGLSNEQVKRALRDINIAGMRKRNDGRFQVKGRKVL